jgi:hypothetical protein
LYGALRLVSHLVAQQPRAPGSLNGSFDSLAYSQSTPRSPGGKPVSRNAPQRKTTDAHGQALHRGVSQPPGSLFCGRNLSQDLDREDAPPPVDDYEYDEDDDAEMKETPKTARHKYVT